LDLQLITGTSRRADIERAFAHLASGAQNNAGSDPIATMRRFVDRYGDVEARGPFAAGEARPVSAAGVPSEWILPHQRAAEGRIVLIHGGGWVAGSLESHRPMAAALAEMTGLSVLLVDYRLAPEHPFPAAFEDCRAVFGWALENGPDGSEISNEVYLVGDSAGGNLSAAICVDALATGRGAPARLVLMSPALDGSANPRRGDAAAHNGDQSSLETMMSLYLRSRDQLSDPRVSPLFASAEVLEKFPPTLIQASNAEFLVWDAGEFALRLMKAGVRVNLSIWPGMPHVWQAFLSLLPEAKEALAEAASFLTRRCDSLIASP
jgi:acetyl esterase/lipase